MINKKILIVEDDVSINELLCIQLKNAGYNVESALNATRAIQNIDNNDYDLAILDINLPDSNGIEIYKYIKDKKPKIQGIFLTAQTNIENVKQAMKLGAYDYIQKPHDIDKLLITIKRCMEMVEKDEKIKHIDNLLQSEKMAAIGIIAGDIAHELKSPLTGISTVFSVLIKRMGKEHALFPLIEEGKGASDHCAKVIRNLLNFSHKDGESKVPVNCNESLEVVFSFTAHQLEVRNIKIIQNLKPDLGNIMGYKGQLQQVFLNLITNAKDAMQNGGELTITTRETGKNVEIEFKDNGEGMSDETKNNLFNQYYTTKRDRGGTGLGLTICKKIMDKHNGDIKVESEIGKGTVFTIIIPKGEAK